MRYRKLSIKYLLFIIKSKLPNKLPVSILYFSICIAILNLINLLFSAIYFFAGYWRQSLTLFIFFISKNLYFVFLKKRTFSFSIFYIIFIINVAVSFCIYIFNYDVLYIFYPVCIALCVYSSDKPFINNRRPHFFVSVFFLLFYFFALVKDKSYGQSNVEIDKIIICCYIFICLIILSNLVFRRETYRSIKRNLIENSLRTINKRQKIANQDAVQFSQMLTKYFETNFNLISRNINFIENSNNQTTPLSSHMPQYINQLEHIIENEMKYIDCVFLFNQVISQDIKIEKIDLFPVLRNVLAILKDKIQYHFKDNISNSFYINSNKQLLENYLMLLFKVYNIKENIEIQSVCEEKKTLKIYSKVVENQINEKSIINDKYDNSD